jgi:hypothetical protein
MLLMQAGDAAARLRTARSSLAAAKAKQEALLQGPGAQQLLVLVGSPQPIPHGTQVGLLAAVND